LEFLHEQKGFSARPSACVSPESEQRHFYRAKTLDEEKKFPPLGGEKNDKGKSNRM
jgi:hypothetical protein